jgi:hypothetical protein
MFLMAGVTFFVLRSTKDALVGIGKTGKSWVENTAKYVGDFFKAKVSIQNTSYTLNTGEIAELAVLQRRIACYTKFETTRAGLTSTLIIKGVFTLKAGFDLREHHSVTFDAETRRVYIQLPGPKVLSNTTESQEIYFQGGRIIDWSGSAELATAYKNNLEQSKREAQELGFLEEAKLRVRERCQDLFPQGTTVEIFFVDPPGPGSLKAQ